MKTFGGLIFHLMLVSNFFPYAFGENCTPRHSALQDSGDFRDYMLNVSDYYEAPPRKLVSSLSQAMQDRVKPTGKMQCWGFRGTQNEKQRFDFSAQLTVKKDLITTSAHSFTTTDVWGCYPKADPSTCKFIIRTHGVEKAIPVKALIKQGLRCPNHKGTEDDWAVLKLDSAVDDIEPYRIDPVQSGNLKIGDKVATVAYSADLHPTPDGGSGPKHYSECQILKAYRGKITTGVSTACGCSHGCSGGSLITLDPVPALLGIIIQGNDVEEEVSAAQKRGRPDMKHWQEDGNGTYYLTFTGEFLETVLNN